MGKHRNRKANPNQAKYEVGYGKPPRKAQFQKGHTRNATGPRKTATKSIKGIDHFLDEVVSAPQKDGTILKMTRREFGHRNLANKFAAGDLRAFRAVQEHEVRKVAGEESDPLVFDADLRSELLSAIKDEIRDEISQATTPSEKDIS